MHFESVMELIGQAVDTAGIAIIVIGSVLATGIYLLNIRRCGPETAYRTYRQSLGRAILLGLELLVGADIIRTVAISPTFQSVGILAVIVAVRTFLSWTLEVEIEGRWPWQRAEKSTSGE